MLGFIVGIESEFCPQLGALYREVITELFTLARTDNIGNFSTLFVLPES